jgi:hypothetical protein
MSLSIMVSSLSLICTFSIFGLCLEYEIPFSSSYPVFIDLALLILIPFLLLFVFRNWHKIKSSDLFFANTVCNKRLYELEHELDNIRREDELSIKSKSTKQNLSKDKLEIKSQKWRDGNKPIYRFFIYLVFNQKDGKIQTNLNRLKCTKKDFKNVIKTKFIHDEPTTDQLLNDVWYFWPEEFKYADGHQAHPDEVKAFKEVFELYYNTPLENA